MTRRVIGAVLLVLLSTLTAQAQEGFGAGAVGGWVPYTVTSLADSGPGTLRDAVSQCCRLVSFAVAGDINLASKINVAPYSTINGPSAPFPGVTIRGRHLNLQGSAGVHDVVIRGLRIRGSAGDGITVASGAYNVLIDRVSIGGSFDGAIDVTEGSHDVTVSRSFLWGDKLMLIKYGGVRRVTVYRNLFVGQQRMPQVRFDDTTTGVPFDIMADIRNNVMVAGGVPGTATLIWFGGTANVINNFYMTPTSGRSLMVSPKPPQAGAAYAYVAGNVQYVGTGDPNTAGTWGTPIAAAPVATGTACGVAAEVWGTAGAPVRDAEDQATLAVASDFIATLPPGQGC